MSWRDRLQRASFRGTTFHVDDTDVMVGRRTIVQRFPGRRHVIVQDHGLEAETFRVAAYVIGPDYDVARDALELALTAGGPGKLILPTRGEHLVEVTGPVRIVESKRELGYATISFDAVVVDPSRSRRVAVRRDTASDLTQAADLVSQVAQDGFEQEFSVDGLPAGFKTSSVTALTDATAAMREADSNAGATLSVVSDVSSELDAFGAAASSLINTPADLANDVVGLVGSVFGVMVSVSGSSRRQIPAILDAMEGIAGFADAFTSIPSTTPSRQREQENRRAIVRIFRAMAVAEAARAFSVADFSSFDQAQQARDAIAEILDDVSQDVPDGLYQALAELRGAVVQHLEEVASGLPDLSTFTPPVELPAVVVAHILYGDAKREAEIVERNDPQFPGLLGPGDPLEVLSA